MVLGTSDSVSSSKQTPRTCCRAANLRNNVDRHLLLTSDQWSRRASVIFGLLRIAENTIVYEVIDWIQAVKAIHPLLVCFVVHMIAIPSFCPSMSLVLQIGDFDFVEPCLC